MLFFQEVNLKDKLQMAEIKCPKCHRKEIIILGKENIPKCQDCGTQMILSEILEEGKSY
jgi:ribosomal protein L37AE/L43A